MRDSESFEIMRESSAYVGSELFRSSQLIKDGLDEVALTEKRKRFTEYVMNMNLPMDQCLTAIGAIGTNRSDAEVHRALAGDASSRRRRVACDVCGKSSGADQNLQIHRRGHNIHVEARRPAEGGGGRPRARRGCTSGPAEGCVIMIRRGSGGPDGDQEANCRKHGEERRWDAERRKESYAIHRETCEATVGEEESDGGYGSGRNVMGGVNFGIRANAVNTELLFPSLWGRVSSATGDKNAEE
ncbi:uncharacterized protein A4U43_C08F34280 [Asparagus officinalis]|nr:uncharacterized protein A4U43_C08F34280 [Asparagus officinalis]